MSAPKGTILAGGVMQIGNVQIPKFLDYEKETLDSNLWKVYSGAF